MARRPEMLQEVRVKAGPDQDGLSADGAKTVYGGYKPQTRKGKRRPVEDFSFEIEGLTTLSFLWAVTFRIRLSYLY